jgi:hypothetical protein
MRAEGAVAAVVMVRSSVRRVPGLMWKIGSLPYQWFGQPLVAQPIGYVLLPIYLSCIEHMTCNLVVT